MIRTMSSHIRDLPRERSSAATLLAATLATAGLLVALIAQGYLNRKVFAGDAVCLFLWAIALFIIALPWANKPTHKVDWFVATVRVLVIVLAVLVTITVYQDLRTGRNFIIAVVLAFLPLMLLGAAFAGSRTTSRPDDEPDAFLDSLWQRVKATPAQWSLDVLFLLAGGVLALLALAYWFKQGKSNDAILLNILSLFLLFIGIHRLDRSTVANKTATTDAPRLWTEITIVVLIVTVGAFLRLWQLDTVPYGVWYDEGETGLEALRIFNGIPYTPIGTYSANNPSLFFYVIAFVYRFLGPTLLSVRLVQALTGLLAVPALYILLRYMFGWRVAVIGSFLLAVSSWHVDFSRFGMPYSIGAPLFEILTLIFLLWGLRTGRLVGFAWAGLMAGLGMHTYTGFRIFPIAVIIYAVYGFILGKERIRQSIPGFIVLSTIALLTFAPLGTWAIQHWNEFITRTGQTSVFSGKNTPQERQAALENSLRRHIAMLNYHGDGNGRHNQPGAPAVDFVTGTAFIIGLGYCLYRWRSPSYLLLTAWFVVTMQAGIFSLDWEAPQMARTIVAVPAICGIAAIPLGRTWELWSKAAIASSSRRIVEMTLAVAVMTLLAIISYVNYDRYFNKQMGNSESFYAFSTIDTVVARRVAELGPTANRYFIENQGTPAFSFLVGGDTPNRPVDAVFFRMYEHMPLRQPTAKTAVYLLEPWRVTIEPKDVLRYYPHATFIDHKDPFGKTMVYEFQVPPEDVNNLLGLTGHYYAGDVPQGAPLLERTDKIIDFNWATQPPVPQPFNVEWTGSIVPPDAGTYTFEVLADGPAKISIDDQVLDIGRGKTQAAVDLAKGMHPVNIQFSGRNITLYWTPPRGQRQVVPLTALIAATPPQNGLVGRYYRGETWQGRPEFVQVDPYLAFRWHPDPIEPGPWSAIWTGKINAPQTGRYVFQGVSNDRFWLIIDGRTYLNGTPGLSEVQIDLTAGLHDIQVKYANNKGYSELRLSWRRPDGVFEVVPNSNLLVK